MRPPLVPFHKHAAVERKVESNRAPSGLKASAGEKRVEIFPISRCFNGGESAWPVAASQIRATPSLPKLAARWPSGLKATAPTIPPCGIGRESSADRKSVVYGKRVDLGG